MDGNVEAALIGGAIVIVIAILGWAYKLQLQVASNKAIAEADNAALKSKMEADIAAVRQEHLHSLITISKEYASVAYLKDVEERLVTAINSVSDMVSDLKDTIIHLASGGSFASSVAKTAATVLHPRGSRRNDEDSVGRSERRDP